MGRKIEIKDQTGLISSLKDAVVRANLDSRGKTIAWGTDKNGKWYRYESDEDIPVLESMYLGTDELIHFMWERLWHYDGEDLLGGKKIADKEGTTTKELYKLYEEGRLKEVYPAYDWDGMIDYASKYEVREMKESIEEIRLGKHK